MQMWLNMNKVEANNNDKHLLSYHICQLPEGTALPKGFD